jgi:hypothetical protein
MQILKSPLFKAYIFGQRIQRPFKEENPLQNMFGGNAEAQTPETIDASETPSNEENKPKSD